MKFEKDLGIEEIKVIENFLSPEEVDFFINYMNNNIDIFDINVAHGGAPFKRIMFGKDSHHTKLSYPTLDKVKDIEPLLRKDIFPRIELAIKEAYGNKKDFMVCSFFMTKQYSGSVVKEHIDTDGGTNMQFKYGGVIYLNEMKTGGELKFKELNYEHAPKAGGFIVFPSRPYQYKHSVEEIHEDRYLLAVWVTEYPLWKL